MTRKEKICIANKKWAATLAAKKEATDLAAHKEATMTECTQKPPNIQSSGTQDVRKSYLQLKQEKGNALLDNPRKKT
jgi:hypothetical protein